MIIDDHIQDYYYIYYIIIVILLLIEEHMAPNASSKALITFLTSTPS